jgi:hypothetical protein
MSFRHGDMTSRSFIIETLYNPFSEYITGCETVWYPDFDAMKALLLLGVRVQEDVLEVDRKNMFESEEEEITLGTYKFFQDCKQSSPPKFYKFVINNRHKKIWLVHDLNKTNGKAMDV